MKYFIIASGFNCASFVKSCYESLIKLGNDIEWNAELIDDGSADNFKTQKALLNLPKDKRIKISYFKDNLGASHRRFFSIQNANLSDEDVIILLGLDDQLLSNALIQINAYYSKGVWMTYGNWINQNKQSLSPLFLHFNYKIHLSRSYRTEKYRSTAPNTFKKFLFDEMSEEDFKFKGEWIKATTESNLMFSCMEMCGKEKIGVITKPIYLYNKGRIDNARSRFGEKYQNEIYADVVSKPKRNLLIR